MDEQKWIVVALSKHFDATELPLLGMPYVFTGNEEGLRKALADAIFGEISYDRSLEVELGEHEYDNAMPTVQFTKSALSEQLVYEAWDTENGFYYAAWPMSDMIELNAERFPGSEKVPVDGKPYDLRLKEA